MFMNPSDVALLHQRGFKCSPGSSLIYYGKDKQGREWQVEETRRQLFFREVKNYRLGVPIQFSPAFFQAMY